MRSLVALRARLRDSEILPALDQHHALGVQLGQVCLRTVHLLTKSQPILEILYASPATPAVEEKPSKGKKARTRDTEASTPQTASHDRQAQLLMCLPWEDEPGDGMRPVELQEAAGQGKTDVINDLGTLRKQGKVRQIGRGRYVRVRPEGAHA